MKLDSIAEHLLLSNLVSNGAVNNSLPALFLYRKPNTAETSALLLPDPAGMSKDSELPGYLKGRLQLIVTGENYDAGDDLAEALSNRLTVRGLDLYDMYIYQCMPRHTPISYPNNEQNMIEHSVTFDIKLRLK